MSETWKDAARQSTHRTVLEVATNGDGTYEIIFNEKVIGSRIPERWLDDELCAHYTQSNRNRDSECNALVATVTALVNNERSQIEHETCFLQPG